MHKVFQIFYSNETQGKNDPGFLPLDNMENKRSDWSEYWPIRNYLLSNQLDPNTFYGFLSPKFKSKTGLDSETVYQFIENNLEADVITFSPFFHDSAFFINVFEQATIPHPDILETCKLTFRLLDDAIDIEKTIMSSREVVFCNYFVAKPIFWREWLKHAEKIFSIAENTNTPLSGLLNNSTTHYKKATPRKVFVIERLTSYMLTTRKWLIANYEPMNFPYFNPSLASYKSELCVLDALKIAYLSTENIEYLDKFHRIRKGIIESMKKKVQTDTELLRQDK